MPLVIPLGQCVARPPTGDRKYPLTEHLIEVAVRSGDITGTPVEQLQYLAGLLHDAGKAQASWQKYIADPARQRGSVPHAFLGAALFFLCALQLRQKYIEQWPRERNRIDAAIVQLTSDIADHHGELKNLDETSPPWLGGWRPGCLEETDLAGLLKLVETHFPWLQSFSKIGSIQVPVIVKRLPSQWRRMVIDYQARRIYAVVEAGKDVIEQRAGTAALVGADRFSVAEVQPSSLSPQQASVALDCLAEYCRRRGAQLDANQKSTLTRLRQQAQDIVVAAFTAAPQARFYTLRMPTGMGKTLAALRIALEACRRGEVERIIYVAPYLTILSQAAREIREATGMEVMEHHHLSILEAYAKNEVDPPELLLQESWQSPVVATTFNQLFRALAPRYAQETIRVPAMRKAFLILDEPQVVDADVWRLFLALLDSAAEHLDMKCLFITATTPPLDTLCTPPVDLSPEDLPMPCRYVVHVRYEPMDDGAVAEALVEAVDRHGSAAAILNTVQDAARVYEAVRTRCETDIALFNLHGAMTALHKHFQIQRIRECLDRGQPTIVVATQIIEAGVDLSFRWMCRARSIVPSVVQAAGRANRHGAEGEPPARVMVFPFMRDEKDTRQYVYERIALRVSDELLGQYRDIPESQMAELCMHYFTELFRRRPATSALRYITDAAVGRWADLQNVSPFTERGYRIPVFVPLDGDWVDEGTRQLLARFGAETPGQLYGLYSDRQWLRQLSFVERKIFLGLMQRFIVPLEYRRARLITNLAETSPTQQPPAIALLRQTHLYRVDTGFGNLVHDLDEWIYL